MRSGHIRGNLAVHMASGPVTIKARTSFPLLQVEEKYLQAADFAGQSARLWTRLRRFNEADRLLRYQMRLCSLGASGENVHTAYQVCGKAVVALVILKLVQEDSVAAGKAYEEAVE